jgi:hypothetical protein
MVVHFNSYPMSSSAYPFSEGCRIILAPVARDGRGKWVLCAQDTLAYYLAVCAPEAGPAARYLSRRERWPELFRYDNAPIAGIRWILSGRFIERYQYSLCLVFRESEFRSGDYITPNRVELWDVDRTDQTKMVKRTEQVNCGAGRSDLMGKPEPPASICLDGQVLVGDFDGDGLDELINFRADAEVLSPYKYDAGSQQFLPMPNFLPGNLTDLSSLRNAVLYAGHFADFEGEGRRDGLLVRDLSSGQLRRFDGRLDPTGPTGNTTFWWAFDTGGGVVPADAQIELADVNGDGFEECVVYQSAQGSLAFLSLAGPSPATGALVNLLDPSSGATPPIDVGQLPLTPGEDQWMFWGGVKTIPDEPGNSNLRDDVIFWNRARDEFIRCEARWNPNAGAQTYWWANTVSGEMVRATVH